MNLNHKNKKAFFLALIATMGLTACQSTEETQTNISNTSTTTSTVATQATIYLSQNQTTVEGSGVRVDGNIITITSGGTYTLNGTLADGQIIFDSLDEIDVELILNGVNITSSTIAPIYVKNAKCHY